MNTRYALLALLLALGIANATSFGSNSVVTCENGLSNFTYNSANIVVVCPPAVSVQITRTPSNSVQTISQTPISNVTLGATINAIPPIANITHIVAAGDANTLINGVTIVAPSKCTLRGSISPKFAENVSFSNSTGSCAVNESITGLPPIFINITARSSLNSTVIAQNTLYSGNVKFQTTILPPNSMSGNVQLAVGQSYDLLGKTVFAPSYPDFLNTSVPQALYFNFTRNTTCATISNVSTGSSLSNAVNFTLRNFINCLDHNVQTYISNSNYWKLQAIGDGSYTYSGGFRGQAYVQTQNAIFWYNDDQNQSGVWEAIAVVLGMIIVIFSVALIVIFHALQLLQRNPPFATTEEPGAGEKPQGEQL